MQSLWRSGCGETARARAPVGTFEEGLRRCLNERGSQGNVRNDQSQAAGTTPPRFWWARISLATTIRAASEKRIIRASWTNNGEPRRANTTRYGHPYTHCYPFNYYNTRTNIIGFTSTYNDFEYTGVVFRLEQSFSTKEYVRKLGGRLRSQHRDRERWCRTGPHSQPTCDADCLYGQQRLPHLHRRVAVDGRV